MSSKRKCLSNQGAIAAKIARQKIKKAKTVNDAYVCLGCMIMCRAEIPSECSFLPITCLADFKNVDCDWRED